MALGSCSKDSIQAPEVPKDPPTDYFVSATSGDDTKSGKRTEPFKSIQKAIDTAASTGGRIFVAGGDYIESLTLASAVSIFGGYKDGTFARDLSSAVTTIDGGATAISGEGADSLTLDGLTIKSADATAAGGSSIAISLSGCKKIVISNNVITAGNGKAGVDQTKPPTPAKSADGSPGEPAFFCGFVCPSTAGGAGGSGSGRSGGRGGTAGPAAGLDGNGGTGPGGNGGTGGNLTAAGGPGDPGGPGASIGSSGGAGTSCGTVFGGEYFVASGGNGGRGSHGGGGGGGGAGGQGLGSGGSGGGGGAGGEGGPGGGGGGGGGASIAILLSHSATAGPSDATIVNNTITSGNGGDGGVGGDGGDAGGPGLLGQGGPGNVYGGAGGAGGNGGSGQRGGHGGGGGGGPSIGIVEDTLSESTRTDNRYSFGSGGSGGASSGRAGAAGEEEEYIKLAN